MSAVLIAPVTVDDQTILPEGSTLSGSILRVAKVGFGIVHETATLVLNFNQVALLNGTTFPLSTRLTDVDNSRERVIPDGSIRGVRSTASISYRFSGYIRIALCWEVHARIAFWLIKTLLVRVPEPEIYYPSGVELTFALNKPVYGNPVAGIRGTRRPSFGKSARRAGNDGRPHAVSRPRAKLQPRIGCDQPDVYRFRR